MILPMCGLALAADDRPRDADHRHGRVEIKIGDADREDLADAGGGAEHDLDDLTELPVGAGTGEDGPLLPVPDRAAYGCDLVPGEHIGTTGGSAEPRDVVHGIARQYLVAHSEVEGETQNDAGLACAVVALLRELFEEVVAAGDADLAEGDVLEEREDEGAHVPLVELPGRAGEAVFEFHVVQPVLDQGGERAVGAHPGEPGVEQRTLGELLLQRAFRGGPRGAGGLDLSALPVPVAVAGARRVSPAALASDGDGAVGADRGARSSHEESAPPS